MKEFFKGWRRKIGVMTLVLACVFAAGWARSVLVHDVLRGGPGGVECFIVSHDGLFSIWIGADSSTPKISWVTLGPIVSNPATHPGIPIPYSIIVFPLTLVSLWLLLSKPRTSTAKKIAEPVPTEGP